MGRMGRLSLRHSGGWIVVVGAAGWGISGDVTDELPGRYAVRTARDPSGLQVWVLDNLNEWGTLCDGRTVTS
jgi:hypothetical protein